MKWYNEPPSWHEQPGVITVTSGAKTDFWRQTHYGFIRDNGNFYYQLVTGDFTAVVKITKYCWALVGRANYANFMAGL